MNTRIATDVSPPLIHTPTATAHQPIRGILLFAVAVFLFACMDTTTKYLSTHYNVPLIMTIRYIVHGLLMVIILAPREGTALLQTQRRGLVIIRALCLITASLFMGLALQRMPVAETTAILFLAPLLVVLMAGIVLHEKVGILSWIAVLMGFVGVMLIIRPGSGLDTIGVLYMVGTVISTVGYQLLSRVLSRTERTLTMLFYAAMAGSLCFGLYLPWSWHGPSPSSLQIALFLSMGITGGLGHLLFTAAYRYAPASILAPINYLQLLWAALIGWIVFKHIPDHWSLLGMLIVVIAGLLVVFRSRLSR